jgi:hypothetical protein
MSEKPGYSQEQAAGGEQEPAADQEIVTSDAPEI